MAENTQAGSVTAIWRFPVKSMKGERLQEAAITEHGVLGDRAFALIDTETGKVVSAKSARHYPDLFACGAGFVEPPRAGAELPPVRITLPDGKTVTSDADDVDDVLSAAFGRGVTLARDVPEEFTIDQYHPDVEDSNPYGHRDAVVEQKLGSSLFKLLGIPYPLPEGAFFDAFPLTFLTTSTLKRLKELRPESSFDERRFRMNVIVDTSAAGFVENDWIGKQITIGDELRVQVTMPDPRCVMTTLAQDELPRDLDIMRTLVEHNRLQLGDAGRYPCAGVYAIAQSSGSVQVGDGVTIA